MVSCTTLWYGMIEQLKSLLEQGNRKDNVEVVNSILCCIQDIVSNQTVEERKVLVRIVIFQKLVYANHFLKENVLLQFHDLYVNYLIIFNLCHCLFAEND